MKTHSGNVAFEGEKFESTFGIEYLKTARLFSESPLSEYYLEVTRAALIDHHHVVNVKGQGVLALLHCIFAHTPSARCEIHFNPSPLRNASQINEILGSKNSVIHHFTLDEDHSIIIDQSFLELLRGFLDVLLPEKQVVPDELIEKLWRRLLFHAACQAGRYDFIACLEPTQAPSSFLSSTAVNPSTDMLLVPLQYIIQHETAHWVYSMASDGLRLKDEGAELRGQLKREYLAALKRATANRTKKYGSKAAKFASKATAKRIEYWFDQGWEEVLCDLEGLRSTVRIAGEAKMSVSEAVVSINILHMLIAAMSMLADEIQGAKTDPSIGSARYLLAQTVANNVLNAHSPQSVTHAAVLHSVANSRYTSSIIQPAFREISKIKQRLNEREVPGAERRQLMRTHGFSKYKQGRVAIVY